MGTRARQFFEQAGALGGLRAKIRLATLARITSTEAETVDENAETIARLERAMAIVQDEHRHLSPKAGPRALAVSADADTAKKLRRHLGTFLELTTQRSLFLGDVETTFRRITEAAAATLQVERASVWLVDAGVTKIVCADLFERTKAAHSSGVELYAKDFAPYFTALREQRTIAAHDAHTDSRTSCFSGSYLGPLGITSMLDVPIWVNQDMAGVVCHEHVGPKRTWDGDEETFAYLMANFAALAMERRR
jgi:hypothetical protein